MCVAVLVFGVLAAISTTASGSSDLWQRLQQCKDSSSECVHALLADTLLHSGDVELSNFLYFRSNHLDTNDSNADDGRSASLPEQAKEFLLTHDVELTLPQFIADDALLRISPRGLLDAVQLDVAERRSDVGSPRLFKRLRKFIGERLMWAFLGLVLVVKLLSLKFMFFLPVIMGVAAAKKLLLKVILFVFPFLGHLFKLCPYYAPTKYHHHHHQIAHLHKLPPHVHDLHAGGVELDHSGAHWGEQDHHHHDHHHHHHVDDDFGYYSDGPGFSSHDIRRNENDDPYAQQRPKGPPPAPHKIKVGPLSPADIENMVLKAEKEAMLKARLQEEQKRVEIENKRLQDKIKTSLKLQEKLKIQSMVAKQTSKLAAAYQPPPPTPQLQPPPSAQHPQLLHHVPYVQHAILPAYQPVFAPPVPQISPSVLSTLQAQMGTQNRFNALASSSNALVDIATTERQPTSSTIPSVDAFYSPILQKIDRVFQSVAIADESCRERLVCNMYNNPEHYSPHSNLISAELSRDANELQKPTTSNSAVIRFYKYVQAARDGQDKRDCATLYPTCTLNV